MSAVIFDMDGVLVESMDLDLAVWQGMLKDHGIDFSEADYKAVTGMKSRDIFKKFLPDLTEVACAELGEQKEERFIEYAQKWSLQLVEGVVEFITKLQQDAVPISVATGANARKAAQVLRMFSLEPYFPVVVTSDDVTRGKPFPDLFLEAAKRLRVAPRDCVVIEDGVKGVVAAHAAGMKCIAITTSHSKEELREADVVVDSFSEVRL